MDLGPTVEAVAGELPMSICREGESWATSQDLLAMAESLNRGARFRPVHVHIRVHWRSCEPGAGLGGAKGILLGVQPRVWFDYSESLDPERG